jgi:hypothetical protein
MYDSHKEMKITGPEWEAFMDDFQQTLDKFVVPAQEQAELKAIVDSTRADIVIKPEAAATAYPAARKAFDSLAPNNDWPLRERKKWGLIVIGGSLGRSVTCAWNWSVNNLLESFRIIPRRKEDVGLA